MKFYTSVTKKGRNILYRGYENGRRVTKKEVFRPTLYVKSREKTDTQSIFGDYVQPQKFDTMYDAKTFMKTYQGVDEYPIFGTDDWVGQFVQENWPGKIEFDETKINIATIDIEVHSPDEFPKPEEAKHPINAITMHLTATGMYHVWTTLEYDKALTELDIDPKLIDFRKFDDEMSMLANFQAFWVDPRYMPDVISGFYSRGFDMPYIVNRFTNLFGEARAKTLSPWNDIEIKTVAFKGTGEMQTVELKGIAQLDFLDIFKKFGYKYGVQESYKLNHIAYVVLGEKKLDYEEYQGLWDLADKNPQKFVDYNIKDTQLVVKMIEKTKLISLVFAMAYKAGVNYSDTLGTTRIWDTIIMRDLKTRNIVVQPFEPGFAENYGGGWVKEPNPGMYNWITTFDLNSLYPNIIVEYNMSPETIIDDRKILDVAKALDDTAFKPVADPKYTLAANGVQYRKDKQGCLPRLVEAYYAERKEVQAEMSELQKIYEQNPNPKLKNDIDRLFNQQMSIKILMNSLYGALGSRFFRHYDIRTAEAITTTGQLTVLTAERAVNEYLNKALKSGDTDYVIAIDTDSIMVDLSQVIGQANPSDPVEFLANFGDKVMEPILQKAFEKLFAKQNGFKPRMVMGREVIASSGFWTAKKRYGMLIFDDDGIRLSEPKLKIKGLEAIKSSTPEMQRNWMKEAIKIILSEGEGPARDYIHARRDEFYAMAPELIGKPSGVSDVNKYLVGGKLVKGTPINSRAAILYNLAIKDKGITNKYPEITNGNKIKMLYLKMPNPIKQNVIGFPEVLPRELGLGKYIDHQKQFEKTFLNAMTLIFEAMSWNIEDTISLEDFF